MNLGRKMKRAARVRRDFRFTREDIISTLREEIEGMCAEDSARAQDGLPPLWVAQLAKHRASLDAFLARPADPSKVFYSDAEFHEAVGAFD